MNKSQKKRVRSPNEPSSDDYRELALEKELAEKELEKELAEKELEKPRHSLTAYQAKQLVDIITQRKNEKEIFNNNETNKNRTKNERYAERQSKLTSEEKQRFRENSYARHKKMIGKMTPEELSNFKERKKMRTNETKQAKKANKAKNVNKGGTRRRVIRKLKRSRRVT